MVIPSEPYEQKFANFIRLCAEAKDKGADVVTVAHPQVLGDDYEELIESLNRLASAQLMLAIAGPVQESKHPSPSE